MALRILGAFFFLLSIFFEKDKQAKSKCQALIHVIHVTEILKHENEKHLYTHNNMTTAAFLSEGHLLLVSGQQDSFVSSPKQAA